MSDTLPVSAIVLSHNEERTIEDCLRSLTSWVGEVFVVDSGSADQTREIARRYTEKVVEHPFETYARQRNWAQDCLPLRYPWVLHIDADERVTPELAQAIRAFFGSRLADHQAGAMFSRRTVFLGRWIRHGGHYPVYHLRLYRKDRGRCEDRLYDQHFRVDGPVVRLQGDVVDVLAPDLDTWSMKHLRWAGLEAAEALRPGSGEEKVVGRLTGGPIERRRWLRNQVFGRLPLFTRPFLYFLYRYVVRLGFRDGVEGLIFHFLHGCWYRFYVDAKLWQEMRASPRSSEGSQNALADCRATGEEPC